MKVDITEQELENLEKTIDYSIKSNAFIQLMSIMGGNLMISVDEALYANTLLADCKKFIEKIKSYCVDK